MTQKLKPKTVITTDGEVDDMNSVIRFLLYSNEVNLQGIVLTSSVYHYAGDEKKDIAPYRWTGTAWLNDLFDRYEQVYPYLSIHALDYPTPEALRTMTKIGNISEAGEMTKITEGSQFLENLFLEDDEEKLYVQTWGGTNTTARALKSIEERYRDTPQWSMIQERIYQRLIIYIILDQDNSYASYIQQKWSKLKIIKDRFNFWHFAYAWKKHHPKLNSRLTSEWFKENIKFNHGPLLERYALMGDGQMIDGELFEEQRGSDTYLEMHPEYERYDFISEGDSPSFFYLLDFGLGSLAHPNYGGWGGRFILTDEHTYINQALDYNPYTQQYEAEYSLERWFDDVQNDFAARADWCVADSYDKANHAPSVKILEGTHLTVCPGEKIELHALGSDPDHDAINYRWWRYFEADTYFKSSTSPIEAIVEQGLIFSQIQQGKADTRIVLENSRTDTVTVHVPLDMVPGETIHLVVEVQDEGTPSLKGYARVVLTAEKAKKA